MKVTKEQRAYIRMLEGVMPERDIIATLKDSDDELRWYLRRRSRGYVESTTLVRLFDKSMDFWLSVGQEHVDWEAVLMHMSIADNQKTVARHRKRIPWLAWTDISSRRGLSEWFIEKCGEHIEWNCLRLENTTLSERFMRKYKDKLYWDDIASTQAMSDEFMEEFEDRLDVGRLFANPRIPDQRINNLIFRHNGKFFRHNGK